jgi:hypothetical protein
MKTLLEYLGYRTTPEGREYMLRTRREDQRRSYTVSIGREAFDAGLVRFQDGPEISYLKLQVELAAHEDGPTEDAFLISDTELASYREAHKRQPRWRRPDNPA